MSSVRVFSALPEVVSAVRLMLGFLSVIEAECEVSPVSLRCVAVVVPPLSVVLLELPLAMTCRVEVPAVFIPFVRASSVLSPKSNVISELFTILMLSVIVVFPVERDSVLAVEFAPRVRALRVLLPCCRVSFVLFDSPLPLKLRVRLLPVTALAIEAAAVLNVPSIESVVTPAVDGVSAVIVDEVLKSVSFDVELPLFPKLIVPIVAFFPLR